MLLCCNMSVSSVYDTTYSLIVRPRIRSVESTSSQVNFAWMNGRPLVFKCLVQVMGFPSVECDLFIAITSWTLVGENGAKSPRHAGGIRNPYYYSSPVRKNMLSKLDEFLAGRSQFDSDHRVDFYTHTCQSATSGPLFAFYCPLYFTGKNK